MVACLKVMLLRICMAMVHENVSQASLTLARRCGFLAGELDESFDICINGFLVGDLDEDPRPSNCVQGVKDHHHGLRVPIFLFLLYKGVVIRVEDKGLV